jgi:hypothetical protein
MKLYHAGSIQDSYIKQGDRLLLTYYDEFCSKQGMTRRMRTCLQTVKNNRKAKKANGNRK